MLICLCCYWGHSATQTHLVLLSVRILPDPDHQWRDCGRSSHDPVQDEGKAVLSPVSYLLLHVLHWLAEINNSALILKPCSHAMIYTRYVNLTHIQNLHPDVFLGMWTQLHLCKYTHEFNYTPAQTRCKGVYRVSTIKRPLFRAQEPKAPVTYCDHALSGVRRPLDYLHFRLLLQNRLVLETWYGWSTQGPLQVLLFFGQICPGADPGRGKNRSRGGPLLQETSSSDREATATNQMHSSDLETCGKKCCYFWFHSEVKFLMRFWRLFGLSQICLIYCNFYRF